MSSGDGPRQTEVTFEGPSVVHFRLLTKLGEIRMVKNILPVAPFRVFSEDAWYAEPQVPRAFVALIAHIAKNALEQEADDEMYHEFPTDKIKLDAPSTPSGGDGCGCLSM